MSLSTRRTVRERALLLATVTLFATASAFVVLKYKFLPSVAEEVAILPSIAFGLLAALSFDRMVGTSIHLLRVARLGTKEEKHAVMKGSPAFGDAPAGSSSTTGADREISRVGSRNDRVPHLRKLVLRCLLARSVVLREEQLCR